MTSDGLRSDLQRSRSRLFDAIQGMTEEQFRHLPGGESWNIAVHLAHLLRVERLYAGRAQAALREDGAHCPSTRALNDDDPALAQHLAVPQIVHGMQAARRDLERALDAGDAALDRAIMHETRGRLTIRDIVAKMAAHEEEHAEQIEQLARQASAARRMTIPLTPRPQDTR